MVPGRATTTGGRTGSYDCSYAGSMCLCSPRCGDAVGVLSARDSFLSEKDPVPVLDGRHGDEEEKSGELSSAPEVVRRPGAFFVVAADHKDGMACISVLGGGGAERVVARGMLDTSHGGSSFTPRCPGVDAVLEEQSSRFIASSRLSSSDRIERVRAPLAARAVQKMQVPRSTILGQGRQALRGTRGDYILSSY